ncbi:MAG: hypothetical protein AABW83_01730 [Nanoarchaeota archaeon]|mgnify:CR=1 FL=1
MGYRETDSKCGIFIAHSLHDVYNGLINLQHRGQDSAGIACMNDDGYIDVLRWEGKVRDFSLETASKLLDGGILFMGEIRYSTNRGKTKGELFDGALPRYLGNELTCKKKYDAPARRHIIIRRANQSLVHNGNLIGMVPSKGKTDSDILLEFYVNNGLEKTIETFPASYAAGILDFRNKNDKKVYIFKDRYGIRPLWIGKKDGRLIASSEDVAIINIGGKPIRELFAGEILEIPPNGTNFDSKIVSSDKARPCFFERHYLGSNLSSFEGMTNQNIRLRLGEVLAEEFFPEIDIVSYIPNAPEDVARGYAGKVNKKLVNIFYKLDNERSFLNPTLEERAKSIGNNLFVRDNININGAKVLVCDDSVVRFNNAPYAAKKIREAGAKYIALAVATPLIGPEINGIKHHCPFGIDMPENDDFLSRKIKNLSELKIFANQNGFDDIYFISKEGMEKANRTKLEDFCAFCIGEPNPVKEEELKKLVQFNLS